MKGIVLAGGAGSRLYPLTKITNKHLLPMYKKPMIYYPIETLVRAGITDIMVVCGGQHAGEFLRLLGTGSAFKLRHLNYAYQETEGGIAEALALTRHFVGNDKSVVILGDNIFGEDISPYIHTFRKQKSGARILLKEVERPEEYGVVEFSENGDIKRIIEKPKSPSSSFVVTGLYMYDNRIFDIISQLKPSARNELEITDVNNIYLQNSILKYDKLKSWWCDAGESLEAYYKAIGWIAEISEGKRLFA